MTEHNDIENAIGGMTLNSIEDPTDYEGVNELTGVDMVAILQSRVNSLINENMALNKRLNAVEVKTDAMYAQFIKGEDRSRFDFPHMDKVRQRYVTEVTSLSNPRPASPDTNSFVDVDTDRSGISDVSSLRGHQHERESASASAAPRQREAASAPPPMTNPFASYFESPRKGETMFKSTSATAPLGYVNKGNVWGTALASLLTAAMRYYISKKDERMLMVDEAKMATIYTKLAPVLYEAYMTKELPGVSSPLTFRLSQAISRKSKTDVPLSYAKDWIELEDTQEGRDIMGILRVIVMAARTVPEAMVHPISQLIPSLYKELVMKRNELPVFVIDASVSVNPTPSQWESWCMILKTEALVKYVKYRLTGTTPLETMQRMTSEMKLSELAEKKNWQKLTTFNPAVLTPRTSSPS